MSPTCSLPFLSFSFPVPGSFSTYTSLQCRRSPPPLTAASPTNGAAPSESTPAGRFPPSSSFCWRKESSRGRRKPTAASPTSPPRPCRRRPFPGEFRAPPSTGAVPSKSPPIGSFAASLSSFPPSESGWEARDRANHPRPLRPHPPLAGGRIRRRRPLPRRRSPRSRLRVSTPFVLASSRPPFPPLARAVARIRRRSSPFCTPACPA